MNLQNFGLKQTKTRQKLLEIMKKLQDPITAEEAYKLLLDDEINLSTVYRTLTTFCERGLIKKEIRKDGKATYLYIREKHHHVLICIKCNSKIYLDDCPFLQMNKEIYNKTGFVLDNHNIELYGTCKSCNEK